MPVCPSSTFLEPVEQLNLTLDLTEYCWYSDQLSHTSSSAQSSANLTVDSGHRAGVRGVPRWRATWARATISTKSWPFTSATGSATVTCGRAWLWALTQLSLLSIALGIENGMGEDEIGYEQPLQGHQDERQSVRSDSLDVTGES